MPKLGSASSSPRAKCAKDLRIEMPGRIERIPTGADNVTGVQTGRREVAAPCFVEQIGFDLPFWMPYSPKGCLGESSDIWHLRTVPVRPNRAAVQK